MKPSQLHMAPGPEEWSAVDILAHLRACADVWGGCITKILSEDRPTIRAVNPRTWIEQTEYRLSDFKQSLRSFTRQRQELLLLLTPLQPRSWSRTATVTGAGRPLVRTALFYADRLARHEQPHVKQIERIVDAVGDRAVGH